MNSFENLLGRAVRKRPPAITYDLNNIKHKCMLFFCTTHASGSFIVDTTQIMKEPLACVVQKNDIHLCLILFKS